MLKIGLSAGHSKNAKGKQTLDLPWTKKYDPIKEWELNNRICDLIEKNLKNYEVQIVRLDDRSGNKDVKMPTRIYKAYVNGIKNIYDIHHDAFKKNIGTGFTIFKSKFSKTSLSHILTQNFKKFVGLKSRGVRTRLLKTKKDYYYMIRESLKYGIECVLIECGFMTNETDLKTIATEEGAIKIANAITQSLISYHDLKKKPILKPIELGKDEYFVIQLGAYKSEAEATEVAQQFVDKTNTSVGIKLGNKHALKWIKLVK